MSGRYWLVMTIAGLAVGCSFDPGGSSPTPEEPAAEPDAGGPVVVPFVAVRGQVTEFGTSNAIAASLEIEVVGLPGSPEVLVDGSEFTINDVPRQSLLSIRVVAQGYRPTLSDAIVVGDADVDGLELSVVSDGYAESLAMEFGVEQSGNLLIAMAGDDAGAPLPGLPKAIFELQGAPTANGPFFLAADATPDVGLDATSDSGYVVFQNMPAGQVSLAAAPASAHTIVSSPVQLSAGEVAVRDAIVTPGELELPPNVSLSNDILNIFEARGCVDCHTRDGIGKDLGGLSLDGGTAHILSELTQDPSPRTGQPRVNTATPEASLVLTRPSAEYPADVHPYTTFNGYLDPDYLKILSWIYSGPADN